MKIVRIGLIVGMTALLAACAQTVSLPPEIAGDNPPGFWLGLWHGLIAVFAFIGSLFNDNISVYAINNTGGWYDFGFLLGIGAFSTGASRSG